MNLGTGVNHSHAVSLYKKDCLCLGLQVSKCRGWYGVTSCGYVLCNVRRISSTDQQPAISATHSNCVIINLYQPSGSRHCLNPSGRTMSLGSVEPLTEMSTRAGGGGKGGRCVGLTTSPLSCADCLQILGASTS